MLLHGGHASIAGLGGRALASAVAAVAFRLGVALLLLLLLLQLLVFNLLQFLSRFNFGQLFALLPHLLRKRKNEKSN